MKLISIIIPVYNAENTLRKCVESIVYGEERNVEVILIEDCSRDKSWEICEKLEEEFTQVKCYKNSVNRGVSYSRNNGLRKANGNYIAFVDSDDWVSGKYIKKLNEMITRYPDYFVLCGYHYYDIVEDLKKDYLWNTNQKEVIIDNKNFFELLKCILLQQLWNKVFRRDIIEKNNIHFDESQSMGEDFQFVLDYMQAAQIKECMLINQPLYYYIRANNSSLMSKFGLIENGNEFKRLVKLRNICGSEDPIITEQYQKAVQDTKCNYIYQICRNMSVSNAEKITLIEKIAKDGNAKKYFKEQRKLIIKERTVQKLKGLKVFQKRIEGRLRRERRDYIAKKACKQLKAREFSIISQNCIGGVFYHDAGMQFLSPTVNLFFKEPDFVKFVLNLEYYLNLNLEMCWEEEYPVGKLEDISIYFMHYHTCREAGEAWNRRKKRINWNRILVLATDMEGFDEDSWKLWCQIKYPKILFTVVERDAQGVVVYPQYKKNGFVRDLIPDREFYRGGVLIKIVNAFN